MSDASVDRVDAPVKYGHGGKRPGSGRKKGVPNKVGASLRQAFLHAFEAIGGRQGLSNWAADNPTEFYRLCSRLLPVQQHISGPDGGPIRHAHSLDDDTYQSRVQQLLAHDD